MDVGRQLQRRLSVEAKGRAIDDCPRLRLPNQCCLAERGPPFEERFSVCDEQGGAWPDDSLVGSGVRRYGVRVNALAAGFILTDLTRKLWADPGMQEWGTARLPLRFGWRGAIFGQSGLFFCDGQILYVDRGFTAGLGVADSGAGCLSVVRR